MEKAQAIFATANKATRPEKEHILKFMAGTRGKRGENNRAVFPFQLHWRNQEFANTKKNVSFYDIAENPCPELGNIVTIKLSERQELHHQRDGAVLPAIVETHFQMNYNTGEWKVITKPPKIIQW